MKNMSMHMREAAIWAFLEWRKHWKWFIFLWSFFVIGFFFYALIAGIVSLFYPLLALVVYLIGSILPSYIYAAFIKIAFAVQADQRIYKNPLRYLSIGAALDILLSRIFVLIFFAAFLFITIPFDYVFPAPIITIGGFSIKTVLCFLAAYGLFYFYPYVVTDTHSGRFVFRETFRYAYQEPLMILSMSFLWFLAMIATFATAGIAGFFVIPVLTFFDVYIYHTRKPVIIKSQLPTDHHHEEL